MNYVTKLFSTASLIVCLAGCSEKVPEESKESFAAINDRNGGVFTVEFDDETSTLHFGYSTEEGILMNGSISQEQSAIYHAFGRDESGNEIVLADTNFDGMPDFWLLVSSQNEVLKKVPAEPYQVPF